MILRCSTRPAGPRARSSAGFSAACSPPPSWRGRSCCFPIRSASSARSGGEKFFEIFSSLPRGLFPPAVHLDLYYYPFGYSHQHVTTIWVLKLLLWTLITGSFIGYLVAYLTRAKAQSVAAGFMQTAFPVMVAGRPFVTLNSRSPTGDWFPESSESHITGLYGILGMLVAGGALQLMSLLALRRGFTIMSEARVLIRSGIYRWIRHPVYCSHFLINLCYTLVHFHAVHRRAVPRVRGGPDRAGADSRSGS